MNTRLRTILSALLLSLCATAQAATTYYVSPAGNDSWTGLNRFGTGASTIGPKLTFAAVEAVASSGDTIQIDDPTTATFTTGATLSKSGLTWVKVTATTPEFTAATVRITGSSITFDGVTFTNPNGTTGGLAGSANNAAIRVDGGTGTQPSGVTVRNCIVNGGTSATNGILVEQSDSVTLHNNTIATPAADGINLNINDSDANPAHVSPGCVVTSNTISATGQNGIYTEISGPSIRGNTISNVHTGALSGNGHHGVYCKSADAVISGNTISDVKWGDGISIRNTGTVRKNVVYACYDSGISVSNTDILTGKSVLVENNKTYGNGLNGTGGGLNSSGSSAMTGWVVTFKHNTCYERNVGIGFATGGQTLNIINNIFALTSTADSTSWFIQKRDTETLGGYSEHDNQHYTYAALSLPYAWQGVTMNLTSYQTASGAGQNILTTNPEFYDYANSDFRLTANSPGKVAANVDWMSSNDFAGATRTDPASLGAYEYVAASPPSAAVMTFTTTTSPGLVVVQVDWVSDASGDCVRTFDNAPNGRLIGVTTDPGSSAPTDNWDLTIVCNGADALLGAGLNRDTTNTEYILQAAMTAIISNPVTPSPMQIVIDNAGDSKTGQIFIWIERLPAP